MNVSLSSLDYGLIGLYGVAVIWIGLRLAGRHHSAEDYFLAGRRMTWPLIGISLFASNISSTTLVGLAGDAYHTGISVFNYEWMAAIVLVFFAIFILPFVLSAQVYTIPEYLERRYDGRVRTYFSVLTLFLNIIVDTAGSLFAGGLLLKLIFPDLDTGVIIAVLAVVAGLYTIAGGLAAVIYTDAIQTVLLLVGAVVITAVAYDKVGGWSAMTAGLDPGRLSLIRPLDDPGVPWLGLLLGVPLLGFYFWCANQFMVQRVLSARSVEDGRRGVLLAGLLKLPVLFIMVLPGTMAIHLYPDLPRPDLVYPTLMFDLLPAGLLGLVLAGFVAALMSQIDSTLNAASTLVTMDFVHRYRPGLGSEALMKVGRRVTGLFMLLAALWAPQIEHFPSLFKYLQMVLSYTVPPIVAIYLVGTCWSGANARGAWATVVVGTAAGGVLFLLNGILGLIDLHFLYVGPVLLVISWATLWAASRGGPPPRPEQLALVWTPAFYRRESAALRGTPWWANYRWLSAVLLALTLGLVALFA
ncbi:MAG: sodium:solute symporter [Halieaceae bacterium]|nr:sodium:solute symporter [Halieaceae bacterium]MCP5147898.1 sodium/solute symporter [Pseudomonadales bacterium]MCP5187517.1 sodium/solute symporter [Pseudomonadales bacterium]